MNTNTTAWNRLRYNLYAPFYNIIARIFAKYRKRSVELLELQDGETVLILGAGTGLDIPFLPNEVHIVATDISPAMLAKAESVARGSGRRMQCIVMDGQALDFADSTFDAVLLHLILAVIPDPVACVREVERVLKPNGRVVVLDKFLPDDARPSLLRKLANTITTTLFSDINRQLGSILSHTNLEAMHEEPALLGGAFKIVLARQKRKR